MVKRFLALMVGLKRVNYFEKALSFAAENVYSSDTKNLKSKEGDSPLKFSKRS
jgi:hypothetical protein